MSENTWWHVFATDWSDDDLNFRTTIGDTHLGADDTLPRLDGQEIKVRDFAPTSGIVDRPSKYRASFDHEPGDREQVVACGWPENEIEDDEVEQEDGELKEVEVELYGGEDDY